jgi:hypothetical protein
LLTWLQPAAARRAYPQVVDHVHGAGLALRADFTATDQLGEAEVLDPAAPFDAVTCMFAIHYFFQTESTCKRFLQNVALNLKDGTAPAASC